MQSACPFAVQEGAGPQPDTPQKGVVPPCRAAGPGPRQYVQVGATGAGCLSARRPAHGSCPAGREPAPGPAGRRCRRMADRPCHDRPLRYHPPRPAGRAGFLVAHLPRVWRRSFRSSLLPGVAFTALWSCLLYARLAAAPAGPLLLSAACLTAFQTYYWMQEALFERPAARQLENCLRMAAGFLPQTLAAAAVQLFCLAILPSLGLFGLLAGLWLPSLLALMLVYPPIERALGLEAKIRQVQSNH